MLIGPGSCPLDFFLRFGYERAMQRFRGILILSVIITLSACETRLGQSWNNTVSRMKPDREKEREARYGLRENPRQSVDSDTVYLGPNSNSANREELPPETSSVQLKPFRTARRNPQPTQKATPKPTPKKSSDDASKPKSSPKPTPKSKPTPESTENASDPIDDPVSEATPKPAEGPAPFAEPVPGKKGYVTSPFSPGAGFIDVTGLEPGSEAKDPYSGKVFRVP